MSYSRNGVQPLKIWVPQKQVLRILFLRDKKVCESTTEPSGKYSYIRHAVTFKNCSFCPYNLFVSYGSPNRQRLNHKTIRSRLVFIMDTDRDLWEARTESEYVVYYVLIIADTWSRGYTVKPAWNGTRPFRFFFFRFHRFPFYKGLCFNKTKYKKYDRLGLQWRNILK